MDGVEDPSVKKVIIYPSYIIAMDKWSQRLKIILLEHLAILFNGHSKPERLVQRVGTRINVRSSQQGPVMG